jgi:uncharacterized protein YndB with AHSA1/START domain
LKNQASIEGRELIVNRVLKAPRELVYDTWTDPKHLANWWGPNGFTITILEADIRAGGLWRYLMHGPDGADYPNRIDYIEVVKPERLVYDHGEDEENDPSRFHVQVTFERDGDKKTSLTMKSLFPTVEDLRIAVENYGAVEGAMSTLDRLEDLLATVGK